MKELFQRTKAVYGASGLELDEQELRLINKNTLRTMEARELFAFRATACDNEVDREKEAFSTSTLRQMAKLIPGRPVLSDHRWQAQEMCARVYAAELEVEKERKTTYGEPYACLAVRCYLPRTADTVERVTQLEAGILKEMSIGCAVLQAKCSVCGKDFYGADCTHQAGQSYEGKVCFIILEGAKEVYELSFAAVPVQEAAGVHKSAQEEPFRAELDALSSTVKLLGAQLLSMKGLVEEQTQKAPPGTAPEAPTLPVMEADTKQLIDSARALLKNRKEVLPE